MTPDKFSLEQNYPNPFNPVTSIKFDLPKNSHVTLKVYDVMGREVSVLKSEEMKAGTHDVSFDASNLSSGIYFYKMTAGDFVSIKKMVFVK